MQTKPAKLICALLVILFFPLNIFAWNAVGHMIVANIAYENLKPDIRQKVDTIISSLTEQYPAITTFQQAAFWPDAIRDQRIETFTHWHYVDNSFSTDGSPLKDLIDTDNASWAYRNVLIVVKNKNANQYERTRFLCFLEHLTGDLHQPLHTVANITAKYPNGDRGGNLFYVIFKTTRINLHKLWDEGVGQFRGSSTLSHVQELSAQITAKYPETFFGAKASNLNHQDWIEESVVAAKTYVYATAENQVLSDSYIETGKQVAEQQVALAGYRLANTLNQALA